MTVKQLIQAMKYDIEMLEKLAEIEPDMEVELEHDEYTGVGITFDCEIGEDPIFFMPAVETAIELKNAGYEYKTGLSVFFGLV